MLNTNKLPPFLHLGRQKILETVSDLLGFLYIRIYLTIILLLNLLNWIIVRVINTKIREEPAVSSAQDLFIILHYNVDFGVDLIGDVKRVYIVPLFGLIVIIINLFLLAYFYKNNRFVAHILLAAAVLANIFLIIALSSVYLINFRYL